MSRPATKPMEGSTEMSTIHLTTKALVRHAVAALAALALASTASAMGVAPNDGSAAPGGTASVSFDFDFGAGVDISALEFGLDWNPAQLTLTGGGVTIGGAPVDMAAQLNAAGTLEFNPDSAHGKYSATWYAMDSGLNELPAVQLPGAVKLTLDFALGNAIAVGTRSPVKVALGLTDANFNPIETPFAATAYVTAVPEPASWALMLAGGLGVAGWVRRRRVGMTA